ncbi:MAG: sigma factor G inhibitor Gin [Bacillota bacterium]
MLKQEIAFEEVQNNLLPRCILCKEVPEMGIIDGFVLLGQFVCTKCEKQLLTLSFNDPTYSTMVQKLKDVIYNPKKKESK